MGFPVEMQPRLNLPSSGELYIFDLNKVVTQRFMDSADTHERITVMSSAREGAEQSMSLGILAAVVKPNFRRIVYSQCA